MNIDPRLLIDSEIVFEDNDFCYIFKKDLNPWLMIVPKDSSFVELCELPEKLQHSLLTRSGTVSRVFLESFGAKKVNVANLGNIVAQFHWHIIARYENDRSWPGPIWGTQAQNIDNEEYNRRKGTLVKSLN